MFYPYSDLFIDINGDIWFKTYQQTLWHDHPSYLYSKCFRLDKKGAPQFAGGDLIGITIQPLPKEHLSDINQEIEDVIMAFCVPDHIKVQLNKRWDSVANPYLFSSDMVF